MNLKLILNLYSSNKKNGKLGKNKNEKVHIDPRHFIGSNRIEIRFLYNSHYHVAFRDRLTADLPQVILKYICI